MSGLFGNLEDRFSQDAADIMDMGFTGLNIFLISALKHRL